MTTGKGKKSGGMKRHPEYDRQTKKARDVLGNLDYIDELPDPPKPKGFPVPYGNDGVARPYGWDLK